MKWVYAETSAPNMIKIYGFTSLGIKYFLRACMQNYIITRITPCSESYIPFTYGWLSNEEYESYCGHLAEEPENKEWLDIIELIFDKFPAQPRHDAFHEFSADEIAKLESYVRAAKPGTFEKMPFYTNKRMNLIFTRRLINIYPDDPATIET